MKIINGEARYKFSEAKKEIERIAKEMRGVITPNNLGVRRNGVPGAGGGTAAISMYCKYPHALYAYIQIDCA